ncbi:hypothetical protein MC885_020207, partial [Smutsia gigantea]
PPFSALDVPSSGQCLKVVAYSPTLKGEKLFQRILAKRAAIEVRLDAESQPHSCGTTGCTRDPTDFAVRKDAGQELSMHISTERMLTSQHSFEVLFCICAGMAGPWLGADIMKDFSGLQSSLLLCMILAFSEQESVSVGCTCSIFWAMVEPTLLGQDQVLHPDEVSLGTGCPVTEVTARGYKFNYPVTECGIQKEVFSYGVIFFIQLSTIT